MIPPGLHVAAQPATAGADEGGPAPRLVIVHGAMDRATSFAKLARRLPDLDVVRYDRRGYAGSLELGPAPLAVHVADLLAILGGTPSIVLGHSLGGVIALAAAEQHPDLVRSLCVYEAPTPWVPWWPKRSAGGIAVAAAADPADAAERFMRRMVGDRLWERLPPSTREARRREGPALLEDLRSTRSGVPLDLTRVTVPVVVAHGSESDERHRRSAEELAAELPHAEQAVVEGAQHGAHLTHPGACADLVRRAVALAVQRTP
jgi:pimeloyl-ACP methyl ester carboxylesterase